MKTWNFVLIILTSVIALTFVAKTAFAYDNDTNILFGDAKHQISVHGGVSLRHQFENLYMFEIQYSQANTFFGLDARQNLELITARGFGNAQKYSQDIILGISEDAIVFHTQRFYIGATLGAYIKSQKTDRISSKFTFGQKFFIGLKFLQNSAVELYVRHFSNGSLTELNSGQNFMGLSYTINF